MHRVEVVAVAPVAEILDAEEAVVLAIAEPYFEGPVVIGADRDVIGGDLGAVVDTVGGGCGGAHRHAPAAERGHVRGDDLEVERHLIGEEAHTCRIVRGDDTCRHAGHGEPGVLEAERVQLEPIDAHAPRWEDIDGDTDDARLRMRRRIEHDDVVLVAPGDARR